MKAPRAWRGGVTLLVVLACLSLAPGARAQSVLFTTGMPTAGVANGVLYVFIPFSNTGQDLASSVQVSVATLAGHPPDSPTFPTQHGALIPGTSAELELHFNAASFVVGQRYLLTLRGTYQDSSAAILGFTLNRFITVQNFTADQLATLQDFETADAIKQFIAGLPGVDPTQDNQSLLTFLQGRPEVLASGSNDTTVWAQFADGRYVLFANQDMAFPATPGPTPFSGLVSGLAANTAAAAASSAIAGRTPVAAHATVGQATRRSQLVPLQAAAASAAPVPGLPVSSSALLLTSLSQFWPLYDRLFQLLNDFNYVASPLPATVANLRKVGGQGIVLLTGHGGSAALPPHRYVIASSDPIDPNTEKTDADTKADPTTGAPPILSWIFVEVGKDANGNPIKAFFYGIGAEFVTKYWQQQNGGFDPSSFAFINACDSDTALSSDFESAVLAAGAGTYGGWSGPVNSGAAVGAVSLTFDRLLGADQYCPEDGALTCTDGSAAGADANPPVYAQRPFPPAEIARDATLHSTSVPADAPYCPSGGVCPLSAPGHALQFEIDTTTQANTFFTLAPSIVYMDVLEDSLGAAVPPGLGAPGPGSQLLILGEFGAQPGTVTIGGQTLTPCHWNAAAIDCVIPDDGPLSSGAVQVTVDDHPSNEAALTRWNGTWTFRLAGPDSISQISTFKLGFRGDARKWRPTIHDPPMEPNAFGLAYIKSSNGTYTCSGSTVVSGQPNPVTFSWSGSGILSVQPPTAAGSGFYWGLAMLTDSLNLDYSLQDSGSQATTCLGTTTSNSGQSSGPFGIYWPEFSAFFQSDFMATLDRDANIAHGSESTSANVFSSNPTTATLSWPDISPVSNSAPDPKSPR